MTEVRDGIQSPLLRRFHDYWAEKRGSRRFPSRADIDPIEFSFALGHVSLIDVLYEPLRFRYRLVASHITDHLGYEMTGRFVSEVPEPRMRTYTVIRYTNAVMAGAAVHEAGDVLADGRYWRHETLFLPLSADDVIINMLAVCRVTDRPRVLPEREWQPLTSRGL